MNPIDRGAKEKDQALAMSKGDYTLALAIAKECVVDRTILDRLTFNSSGVLIDCGSLLGDQASVDLGMELARELLDNETLSTSLRSRARYYLSNGYAAKALHCEHLQDVDGRRSNWENQRDELQILVLNPEIIPKDIETEVLTNFGNVLSELGRCSEALDMYKRVLAIEPQHPIAAGNAGQLLMRLLGIQSMHNVRLLASAHNYFEIALSDVGRVLDHSTLVAYDSYARSLRECRDLASAEFGGEFQRFLEYIAELRNSHQDWSPMAPLDSWVDLDLLLTVNPYPAWCPQTCVDDLYFDGLATTPNQSGTERFRLLAHNFNQIKEDFALARYQFYLSTVPESYTGISSVTRYADTLEYADFGLMSGMLKSSIRQSVDMLDKVANFLNRYLELGIPDRNVSFASVWYKNGNSDSKRILHPTIDDILKQSNWLRGIHDVAKNLNQYPAPSKDIRNVASHDFLIIENIAGPIVTLHGGRVRVNASEYARQLLVMVKGVLVNTIALVQREEGLKRSGTMKSQEPIAFRFATGITDELLARRE